MITPKVRVARSSSGSTNRGRGVSGVAVCRREGRAPAASPLGQGAAFLDPLGQPGLPWNRRLVQRADGLDQPRRQDAPVAGLVVVQALQQGPPAVLFPVGEELARPFVQHVHIVAAQRRQAPAHAQVDRQAQVDVLGVPAAQFLVVQQAGVGRNADVHAHQPVVDDEVAGDVPQVGVAALPTAAVVQAGMQHLMRHDELGLLQAELPPRVDVDLAGADLHGGDADVHALADLPVLHQFELGQQ